MTRIAAAAALGPLLVVGLVSLPQPATAAETCQGHTATLVGTPGGVVTGTDGPDVIVSAGADTVRARGGDDLVCATGSTRLVDAGPGDDTVDARQRSGRGRTILGDGDDTFTGGSAYDDIASGPYDATAGAAFDSGLDTVSTGRGGARVTTGQDLLPNADSVVVRGSSSTRNEVVFRGTQAPAGVLQFDVYGGKLLVRDDANTVEEWVIDNHAQRVTAGAETVVAWTGTIHRFGVHLGLGVQPTVKFVGTDMPEEFSASGATVLLDARMGGGSDKVRTGCTGLRAGSHIAFEAGSDIGFVKRGDGGVCRRVEVRLDRGLLSPGVSVRSLENLNVSGHAVLIHGDHGPNYFWVHACEGAVLGAGDADNFRTYQTRCDADNQQLRLYGGSGGDRLVGSARDEVLVGGFGHDRAWGRGGTDFCRAEVTRTCERP